MSHEAGWESMVLCERSVSLGRLEEIGRRLASALVGGDLVLLEGPLGAGKTALVRAVARALHVVDPVRSPSFTIANVYEGDLTVHHLDLYRLGEPAEEDVLALDEYVREDAVTLVEWPEAGRAVLGPPAFIVRLTHETPETRMVAVEAGAPDAVRRWQAAPHVSRARGEGS